MAATNLRIIYKNIASSYGTLTATNVNTSFPITNVNSDNKGSFCRTTTTTTAITMTWTTNQTLAAVVLPYTNLSSTATFRVRLYSNEAATTLIYDSGVLSTGIVLAGNQLFNNTRGANYRYSFGGGSCVRKYFAKVTTCRAMVLDIVDTSNTDGYIEVGKIVAGDYWSPTYNTEFGLSVGVSDSSTKTRTQNGSLVTDIGTSNKYLSFSLNYLTYTDRNTLYDIINTIGTKASLYVSLFPEDADTGKEYIHQIYGRLSDLATISHPMYTVYASSINIEEV